MGGRGSSGGKSISGKEYGTEYKTLHQSGNIKFIMRNANNATAPLETMTKGRIYVTINSELKPKTITYYDKRNKRYKQIDLDHTHNINGKLEKPHKHLGYYHNEKGDGTLSATELNMVDRVKKTWYNKNR